MQTAAATTTTPAATAAAATPTPLAKSSSCRHVKNGRLVHALCFFLGSKLLLRNFRQRKWPSFPRRGYSEATTTPKHHWSSSRRAISDWHNHYFSHLLLRQKRRTRNIPNTDISRSLSKKTDLSRTRFRVSLLAVSPKLQTTHYEYLLPTN